MSISIRINPVKSQKLNCEGVFNHNAFVLRPKAQWPTGWLWLTYYYYWSTLFVVHLQSAVLKCDNLSYRNFLNLIYTGSSLDIKLCAFPPFGKMLPLVLGSEEMGLFSFYELEKIPILPTSKYFTTNMQETKIIQRCYVVP